MNVVTKKKIASSSRARKVLEFPPSVLAVKELLRKKNSKYFSTMKKLTESEDLHREEALKRMWLSLEKANKEKSSDNYLIANFVGLASCYSESPPYFYQTISERKQLIKELKELTGQLIKKLQHNQFDHRLAYSDKRNGLYFYERLDFIENMHADQLQTEMPRVSEILTRLLQSAEKDINSAKNRRNDENKFARQFVRHMAAYLKDVYGTPMNSVLIAAAAAIFDIEYKKGDIRKILKR